MIRRFDEVITDKVNKHALHMLEQKVESIYQSKDAAKQCDLDLR